MLRSEIIKRTLAGFETLPEFHKTSNMIPLEHGKYYHIYNRGNNREDLFRSKDNYAHFLRLYEKYIYPIADTYAWVLLKNHFHFLVRIKEEEEITNTNPDRVQNPVRVIKPHLYFSHFFNSYTQSFNKTYNRHGNLFHRPFQRIEARSDEYLRHLVIYIHTNPVHHGFTDDFTNYPWSSYQSLILSKPTRIKRDEVICWFSDIENLKYMHQMKINYEQLNDILLE